MGALDQPAQRLPSYEPLPPVWRMQCRCWFRAGKPGDIAACACRYWWRLSKRGRWYAISQRRAFHALLPDLMRDLGCFETTGGWPGD